jgi:adenine-specific DNA-methyltransferase
MKITKYDIKPGDGVFVIQKSFFKNLNRYEKTILKPLYEPTDLGKYFINNENSKEIIYSIKKTDSKEMPTLLSHLEKFKDIMDERRENKNGRLKYYHLHWSRDDYFFISGPKILSIRKCAHPTFTYTEKEAYVMMSVNVIRSERINMKYLTGLLNSNLIVFWLKHKGKMQGSNYQIDKEPIIALPIVKADQASQDDIASMVTKIINILGSENRDNVKLSKVKELEQQIDQMVYELYGLTKEEIKVVENLGK